jgi:hypothetical protein
MGIGYTNDVRLLTLGKTCEWSNPSDEILGSTPPSCAMGSAIFDTSGTLPRMIFFYGRMAYALSLEAPMRWGEFESSFSGNFTNRSAVFDPEVCQILCFGGGNRPGPGNNFLEVFELSSGPSVWTWSESEWTGKAPGPRWGHTAVWDTNTHRMVIYAGYNGLQEIWELY